MEWGGASANWFKNARLSACPFWSSFLPYGIFFSFNFKFFNYILRNEPVKTFFLNLTLLSRVNLIGAIYEGVVPYALARLMGLSCAESVTWCHVGFSRVGACGVIVSPAAKHHMSTSQSRRHDLVAPTGLARLALIESAHDFFLLSLLSFSLLPLFSHDRRRLLIRRCCLAPSSRRSQATPVLTLPEGWYPLLSE
jgi:hypothetical protein